MRTRLIGLAALALAPAAVAAVGGLTSIGGTGHPALAPALSADGAWLVFATAAPLTGQATGGHVQLYAHDLRSGLTQLVSASARGVPANADVDADPMRARYGVSFDGRYVAFSSTAANLVPGDGNGAGRDVFRKDLVTGAVTLVDVTADGSAPTSGVLGQPSISGDGNRVAFASGAATGLAPGDGDTGSDVLVRDIRRARTILASVGSDGRPSPGSASQPMISADGRVVAFEVDGASDGFVPGDGDGGPEVVVRDLVAGETRALAPGEGSVVAGPALGGVSGDGRAVVFASSAPYAPGDRNGASDVYLARPFEARAPQLVSAVAGRAGSGASTSPSLSADGTRVAFLSAATDLVAADANGAVADVLVAGGDTLAREGARVGGLQPAGPAQAPVIAGSGAALAFGYDDAAGSFLPGDADRDLDVIVRERARVDTDGPVLAIRQVAAGVGATARRRVVTGSVSDTSGVVEVTIGGRPIVLDADGRFSVTLARPDEVAVVAVDGAGNRTTSTLAPGRASLPAYGSQGGGPGAGPRARGLRVTLGRRSLAATFDLDGPAPVRVLVDRRVAGGWVRLAGRARRLAAGHRRVVVPLSVRSAGVLRVRVLVAGAGVRQAVRVVAVVRGRP